MAEQAEGQNTLESIPQSPELPSYQWFASTDKTGKNDDFVLIPPGQTRRIPLAAGQLERLWSTSLFPDQIDMTLVSGAGKGTLLLSGGKASHGIQENKTFTLFPADKNDPLGKLTAGATLIATNKAKLPTKWFYQATIRPPRPKVTFPEAKGVTSRNFKMALELGEEKVIENWNTPGEITELSISPDASTPVDLSKIRLKASFDGQAAIDAPLLSLAGEVAGKEKLKNAIADFDGSRLVLRWPMPFSIAKLSLVNGGTTPVKLSVGTKVAQFDRAPSAYRFCAVQQSGKTEKGKLVPILDVKGAGALMGLALSIEPSIDSTKRTFAYLEGDETITADGNAYRGTGTEDYFSSAWYFPAKPFGALYQGLTLKTAIPPAISAYRLMIPDPIPFKNSLKFDFEQGNGNNTDDLIWTWTAFTYQKPPLTALSSGDNATVTVTTGSGAPVPANEQWKIWLAVALGILLGIGTAATRRRRD